MRRMLSSGNYIEYKTIKDTAIIKSFIKTKAYSNQANIESKIDIYDKNCVEILTNVYLCDSIWLFNIVEYKAAKKNIV